MDNLLTWGTSSSSLRPNCRPLCSLSEWLMCVGVRGQPLLSSVELAHQLTRNQYQIICESVEGMWDVLTASL